MYLHYGFTYVSHTHTHTHIHCDYVFKLNPHARDNINKSLNLFTKLKKVISIFHSPFFYQLVLEYSAPKVLHNYKHENAKQY